MLKTEFCDTERIDVITYLLTAYTSKLNKKFCFLYLKIEQASFVVSCDFIMKCICPGTKIFAYIWIGENYIFHHQILMMVLF